MRHTKTLIKAILPVNLLCVAFILAGCVRPTPPTQETTSNTQEQTRPQVLPIAQPPDREMSVAPTKMRSAETVVTSETQTTAVEEKAKVALNTKRQTEKKPATRVATPSIAKIEISPRAHSLNPCEQKKFSAAVKDNSGRQIKDANVTWESTDPKIATVNKNGVVTGVSPGFTFIRAINGKIKSNSSSLFVRDKQADRGC